MTRNYPDWSEVISDSDPHEMSQTFMSEQLLCVRRRSSVFIHNERMEVTWVDTSIRPRDITAYHSVTYFLN